MNPSSKRTNVDKRIDEWDFRFVGKDFAVVVEIIRPRDAQAIDHKVDITFRATVTGEALPKPVMLKGADINKLRADVEQLCERAVKIAWERVLIIGCRFEGSTSYGGNRLIFDYTVALRSTCKQFFKNEGTEDNNNFHYYHQKEDPQEFLDGFRNEDHVQISVVPYDAKIEAALEEIIQRMKLLSDSLNKIIAPDSIARLPTVLKGRLLT